MYLKITIYIFLLFFNIVFLFYPQGVYFMNHSAFLKRQKSSRSYMYHAFPCIPEVLPWVSGNLLFLLSWCLPVIRAPEVSYHH